MNISYCVTAREEALDHGIMPIRAENQHRTVREKREFLEGPKRDLHVFDLCGCIHTHEWRKQEFGLLFSEKVASHVTAQPDIFQGIVQVLASLAV